ncbi:hypothetical protein OS175_07420 [Marinicella sp. S1101]|nr:hypothetical protein [Marinicella marina]
MNGIKSGWIFALMLVFTQHGLANNQLNPFAYQQTKKDGLLITGTVRFTQRVEKCLDLLAEKAPERYQFVKQYVGEIKLHKKSGMVATADPPRYEMSARTAFYSLTWCASSMAHDAYHSYLYQYHQPKDKRKTPARLWMGFKAEGKAITYQRQTAKAIGAPENEINYLYNIKGTHSDIDGDGHITLKDYKKRDW